jgi:hypothetical protein
MHSYVAPTSLSERHNRAQPLIPIDGPLVETYHWQAQPQAPRAIDERGLAECGPGFCPKEFGGDGKAERFLNIPLRIAELEQNLIPLGAYLSSNDRTISWRALMTIKRAFIVTNSRNQLITAANIQKHVDRPRAHRQRRRRSPPYTLRCRPPVFGQRMQLHLAHDLASISIQRMPGPDDD